MKSLLIILCIFLLGITCGSAQSYNDSHRSWSKGALDWREFKGRVTNDTSIVWLNYRFLSEPSTLKIGRTKYTYSEITPYLDMTESWVRGNYQNESTLQFCQVAFDLLELAGRKATQEYALNLNADLNDVVRFFRNQYQHRYEDLQEQSSKGQDLDQVLAYGALVKHELDEIRFDPTLLPRRSVSWASSYSLGLSSINPSCDYFNAPTLGVEMGLNLDFGHHDFGLLLDATFGSKCTQDFSTNKGMVFKGDKVKLINLLFTYGYQLSSNPAKSFIPFVGIGSGNVQGPDLERAKESERSNSQHGFMVAAGFMYDMALFRHYYLNSSKLKTNCIRLKPYLSFTNMKGGIGWYPCLNLSLTYTGRNISLKTYTN